MVVNKADRPNARPYEVTDELLELFIDLDATDDQLDSPVVYVSGRDGWASLSPDNHPNDLKFYLTLLFLTFLRLLIRVRENFRCLYQT